ncbi:MAG: hypothetical protein J0H09_29750 [Burkholderiales bacterium]|nr:hypothetical protein [Burkholderiales bacterium]
MAFEWGNFFGSSWDDPKTMMMLGMARGLLEGNPAGQNRATLGQGIARGLLGGMEGYQQGMTMKRQGEKLELEKKQATMREQQLQAELDAKRQEQMRAQQQGVLRGALPGLLDGQGMSGPQAMAQGGLLGSVGPTRANAQHMLPNAGGVTPQYLQAALTSGMKVDDIKTLAGFRNFGRPEVSRFENVQNPDGTVTMHGFTKFGDNVNTGQVPFLDPKFMNLGGTQVAIDPVTMRSRGQWQNSMSPGEVASNRLGWANNAVARDNLTLSQQRFADERSRGQVIEGQDGFFLTNPRTGVTQPLMGPNGEQLSKGRPLPTPLLNDLTKRAQATEDTRRHASMFQDDFGGKTYLGDWSNTYKRVMGDETGQAQWWQDYKMSENQKRNQLFGSALTVQEAREWEKVAVNPRMNPDQIRQNLQRQEQIEARALEKLVRAAQAGGYNPRQIEAATGLDLRALGTSSPGRDGGATGSRDVPVTPPPRQPVQQGMYNGRKVYRYADGSVEYAD